MDSTAKKWDRRLERSSAMGVTFLRQEVTHKSSTKSNRVSCKSNFGENTMRKMNLIAAVAVLSLLSSFATGQVSLNTGYDHSVFSPYQTVFIDPSSPLSNRDLYWINIASAPNVSAGPAGIIKRLNPGWAAAFPGTNWIGPRNTNMSAPGTNPNNPAYTIFRKCFCLLPGYKDARLSFQVRADDTIQVWLNTQTNQVLAPSWGNGNGTPLSAGTISGFHVGKNCVYALVEDYYGGNMGFDLVGSVSGLGILPIPAAGTEQSFGPCSCRDQGSIGTADPARRMRADDNDEQVISEIVKVAEARRAEKQKRVFRGVAPTKQPNN